MALRENFIKYGIFSSINVRYIVTLLHVGGNWDNSSSCGSRSVNCNNSSANVNANNGARGALI